VSNKMNRGGGRRDRRQRQEEDSGLQEKTIFINRVAKVVKGGRRFNFSALVVVGDGAGRVSVGHGKANEVPEAIRKATEKAKRTLFEVPIVDGTVPHYIVGRFGAARVIIRPASPGTGVIAGTTVRSVLDAAGYHNVLTKVIGSNNPHNVVKAVVNALQRLESPAQYATRVGKNVEDLMDDYNVGAQVWGVSPAAHG
jgi:small subunit ribosomal protein S5